MRTDTGLSAPVGFFRPIRLHVPAKDRPLLSRLLGLDAWTKVVLIVLIGTMFMGKGSVYVELAFGGLLLLSTRLLWDPWYKALTCRQDGLNSIGWPLLISVLYGFGQVIYGILQGHSILVAFQILLFNIYPVYLFLGIWVGFRHPGMVRAYIRWMAWYIAFYTPLYYLFLNKLSIASDHGSYALIGYPGTGSVLLLGLLAFESNLFEFCVPILVLTGLTIANQERADWLGLGLALILWGKLSKRMGRVFSLLGVLATILLIAALIDLKLPPLPGRGGELSARGTIGRMAGSVSPQLAAEISGDRNNAAFYYGTVHWRKRWWSAIRDEVSKDPLTLTFGLGYGYPLANLAGNAGTVKEGTRSPHSIFYFALAYSGVVGVVIFFWLELCLLCLLYRVYRVTGQTFGLVYFVYTLSGSFFGNFIEAPSALPFYLLLGLCIGPMFHQLELDKSVEYGEVGTLVDAVELV
jgi:hypothetical protein